MSLDSSLSKRLADAQEAHANRATVYRLYTEDVARPDSQFLTQFSTVQLIARYFPSATLTHADGLWEGQREASLIIEIIGETADRQRVFDLAGDIRIVNRQTAVLITWQDTAFHSFLLTAESIHAPR